MLTFKSKRPLSFIGKFKKQKRPNTNIESSTINSSDSQFYSQEVEKLPNEWELRYDSILCQFDYVNLEENIVQFDSPLEVQLKQKLTI